MSRISVIVVAVACAFSLLENHVLSQCPEPTKQELESLIVEILELEGPEGGSDVDNVNANKHNFNCLAAAPTRGLLASTTPPIMGMLGKDTRAPPMFRWKNMASPAVDSPRSQHGHRRRTARSPNGYQLHQLHAGYTRFHSTFILYTYVKLSLTASVHV